MEENKEFSLFLYKKMFKKIKNNPELIVTLIKHAIQLERYEDIKFLEGYRSGYTNQENKE